MARAVLIAERDGVSLDAQTCFEFLSKQLTPDHLEPKAPLVAQRPGLAAAVLNANGASRLQGTSICLGALYERASSWAEPGAAAPDGSFAILRSNDRYVELVADAAASRTLWYVLTQDQFIASTSQRAIVTLLGSFEPNEQAVPWMLSSGTLGPHGGWDRRLLAVPPGGRITLDRHRWRLRIAAPPVEIEPTRPLDVAWHAARLAKALEHVRDAWQFDPQKWVLPLSGGVDSRGLLLLLGRDHLRTVTWGVERAVCEPTSDAAVAREVARWGRVPHQFIRIDPRHERHEQLLNRFLVAGEGRVARISGYLDGFGVWKAFCDEGIDGIIRGDEAFGLIPVNSLYEARKIAKLPLLTDYFDHETIETFELAEQILPEQFAFRHEESIATWRDRVYQAYRVPMFLAALTDLKSPYVEVANPLLASRVLRCVRQLPDRLRTDKRLWRQFVGIRGPSIPYARTSALLDMSSFFSRRSLLELMLAEIESSPADMVLSPNLRSHVAAVVKCRLQKSVTAIGGASHPLRRVGLNVPRWARFTARRLRPARPILDPSELVFRAFLVARMTAMLSADSSRLAPRQHAVANL